MEMTTSTTTSSSRTSSSTASSSSSTAKGKGEYRSVAQLDEETAAEELAGVIAGWEEGEEGGVGGWSSSDLLGLHKAREMTSEFATFLELASAMVPRKSRSEIIAMFRSRTFASAHAYYKAKASQRQAARDARKNVFQPLIEMARKEDAKTYYLKRVAGIKPVVTSTTTTTTTTTTTSASSSNSGKTDGGRTTTRRRRRRDVARVVAEVPEDVIKGNPWVAGQIRMRASLRGSRHSRSFVRDRLSIRAQVDDAVLGRKGVRSLTCLALASPAEAHAARCLQARSQAKARVRQRAALQISSLTLSQMLSLPDPGPGPGPDPDPP